MTVIDAMVQELINRLRQVPAEGMSPAVIHLIACDVLEDFEHDGMEVLADV